jgi:hypothetical protein
MSPKDEPTQYNDVCRPQFEEIFRDMARKDDQSEIKTLVQKIYKQLFVDNGEISWASRMRTIEQFIAEQKKIAEQNAQDRREIGIAILIKVITWVGGVISALIAGLYIGRIN